MAERQQPRHGLSRQELLALSIEPRRDGVSSGCEFLQTVASSDFTKARGEFCDARQSSSPALFGFANCRDLLGHLCMLLVGCAAGPIQLCPVLAR